MEKKSEEEESVLLIKLRVLLKKKSKSKVRDAAKNSEKLFFFGNHAHYVYQLNILTPSKKTRSDCSNGP
jgi:hypothetical protein